MMIRKRKAGLFSTLGLALMAVFAFSAIAAGSAQAKSWHIEGAAFAGSASFTHAASPVGTFRMEVPGRNLEVKCTPTGSGSISGSTNVSDAMSLSCKPYELKTGKAMPECIPTGPVPITFEGTGEKINNVGKSVLQFEKEKGCVLPLNNELKNLSLTRSYGAENYTLTATDVGTGQFGAGAFAMNVSGTYGLTLTSGAPFGWANDLWYIDGKGFLGEASLVSAGSFKIEIPSSGATFNCTESTTGLTMYGGESLKGTISLSCVLVGQEKECQFQPFVLPVIGSGAWIHGQVSTFTMTRAKETSCTWPVQTLMKIPTLHLTYGPEATSVSVTSAGTTVWGVHTVYFTGSSTWELTGAQLGKKFGWLL